MFASSTLRSAVLVLAGLAAAVTASTAAAQSKPRFVGPTIAHPSRAPDFALRDQHGRTVRLASQRGKVVMITFLYTHCPDACPLTATHINDAISSLGARRNHVVVLAVSVDPRGDTPRAVDRFVRVHRLGPQFHYLTGPASALSRVWRLYQVTVLRQGSPNPDHTLYTLVLDRDGMTRVLFDSLAKPASIAHDVGLLLG
jgi:protein SCO1/2